MGFGIETNEEMNKRMERERETSHAYWIRHPSRKPFAHSIHKWSESPCYGDAHGAEHYHCAYRGCRESAVYRSSPRISVDRSRELAMMLSSQREAEVLPPISI